MKHWYILVFIVIQLSFIECREKSILPSLNLNFKEVSIVENDNIDQLHLTFELDQLLDNKFVSQYNDNIMVKCYLGIGESELSLNDIENLDGYVFTGDTPILFSQLDNKYVYKVNLSLINYSENKTSSNYIRKKEKIKEIVKNTKENCIPCVLYGRVYLDVVEPYLSKTMCLPQKKIIKSYSSQ